MVSALPIADMTTRAALLSRLERRGAGHEADIGAAIPTADLELAMGLLRVLHSIGTPEARAAMAPATGSRFPLVRLEALARRNDGDRFRSELGAMLDGADPQRRLEALAGIAKYRIKAAGAELALRIRSPAFHALGKDDRQQALATLEALWPGTAEQVGIELLMDPGPESDARESTRALACQLLGRVGSTEQARSVLEATARGRARSGNAVPASAALALAAFAARATARAAGTGPLSRSPPSRA
jgi:hypothetical protein